MNKTLLSTAIAMALGVSAQAWANPVTTNSSPTGELGSVSQTATAESEQKKISGAAANEYSTATQDSNNTSTKTDSSTNTFTKTETETDTDNSVKASNNTFTKTSTETETDYEDSFNAITKTDTDTDNSVKTKNSNNTFTKTSTETETDYEDSFNTITETETDYEDSFNTKTVTIDASKTNVTAITKLEGSVHDNHVHNLGNTAEGGGTAGDGARGGNGGDAHVDTYSKAYGANGGDGDGGSGGDGGNSGSASGGSGDGGTGVGGDGGGERAQPFRLKGPAVETIKLDAEIDATDQLEFPNENPVVTATGIAPQLAVLEALVNPSVDELLNLAAQAAGGTLEILPPEAPLVLFVWGRNRVAPVRVSDISITEEAFDPALNPIRAKVSLGLRVMSTDDLGFTHRGGAIFLSYLRSREALAKSAGRASLNALGLASLP